MEGKNEMITENVTLKKNLLIYTSRYANPELKGDRYYTVGISLGHPRWRLGYSVSTKVKDLAPDKSMWDVSEDEFNRMYREKLDGIGEAEMENLINYLVRSADKKDIVLLCFEDIRIDGQYCHRTTLGRWLTEKLGIEVQELPDPSKPKGMKKDGAVQTSLLT